MFDPLDFIEPASRPFGGDTCEEQPVEECLYRPKISEFNGKGNHEKYDDGDDDDDDDNGPITILDLPSVAYASPEVILCVLRLLRPDIQLNFQSQQCTDTAEIFQSREISRELQQSIVNYYNYVFPNARLNTVEKLAARIPSLTRTSNGGEVGNLLKYYTSILKKYENLKEFDSKDHLLDLIVKEVSLRISEQCGRSAQPSMYRDFKLSGLNRTVRLYEPSLTADNLGWKTWGSSLVLSQILTSEFPNNISMVRRDDKSYDMIHKGVSSRPLKVLELGAGTGLVGISWACKYKEMYGEENIRQNPSPIEMYVTDLPDIVENLRTNVKINELDDFVIPDVLDWTDPEPFVARYGIKDNDFDIILIADPIYSPNHPQWIVNMISKFLARHGICFLEIPIRSKYAKERNVLKELLQQNDFEVLREKYDESRDDWGVVKYLYREIQHKN